MDTTDERLLTRNGRAARQLAVLLIDRAPEKPGALADTESRLPRVRDLAAELGVGNGTVQAALGLLEEAGGISTVARGHLGTFLTHMDRAVLWRMSGLGTLLAAMPLPYSRRYEGLATGLRAAFDAAGAPFAITFMRGASTRVTALLDHKVDLVVLSRLAADRLAARHPLELVADLGPSTYVGAHGLLLRRGVALETPRLRVAVDSASEDLRMLTARVFAARADVEWVEVSYMQLRDTFARGEVDATVWNLDEARDHLGEQVDAHPLDEEITRDLSLRNSSAALVGRTAGNAGLSAVRRSLDAGLLTAIQEEVVRGERLPSY